MVPHLPHESSGTSGTLAPNPEPPRPFPVRIQNGTLAGLVPVDARKNHYGRIVKEEPETAIHAP
jgi:hypothetical protein